MAKQVLTVRDVDDAIWRKFRAKTEAEGLRTGQALNEALGLWIKQNRKKQKRPDPRYFLKMTGLIRTGGRVQWSEEVDLILYGRER